MSDSNKASKAQIEVIPPDDSGSDSFARFRYQAKVTFPFVLRCGLGGPEIAVIPEHLEDTTVQYEDDWRFIQIKTRDVTRGLWNLSDLLEQGGALRSLLRCFEETRSVTATYEIHLERSVSPSGTAGLLKTKEGRTDPRLVAQVQKALKLDTSTCADFLSKVRLIESLPLREHIDAVNLALIQEQDSSLTLRNARKIYQRTLARIEQAMAAENPRQRWPEYIMLSAEKGEREIVRDKYLSRSACMAAIGNLKGEPSSLLSRTLQRDLPRPTALESKLLVAGAAPQIIEDATRLRASAVATEFEVLSLSMGDPVPSAFDTGNDQLSDVHRRILIHANAAGASTHSTDVSPANFVWNELLKVMHAYALQIDPNNVYRRDPMLLMGALAELSDQCHFRWGVRNA